MVSSVWSNGSVLEACTSCGNVRSRRNVKCFGKGVCSRGARVVRSDSERGMSEQVASPGRHRRMYGVSFDSTFDIRPPVLPQGGARLQEDRLNRIGCRRAARRFRRRVHRPVRGGEGTT